MNRKLIVLGTATVLTASMASAAVAADRFASPKQPVPYSQLNAYMKGSESKRAAILAQSTDATSATSAGANVSATTPATPAPTASPDATTPAPATAPPLPPPSGSTPGPVNPPADVATPPTSPSSPPQS
jgi:hypothetical protein